MEDLQRQLCGLKLGVTSVAEQVQAAEAPLHNPVRLVPLGSGCASSLLRAPSQQLCRVARPVGPELATSLITLRSCTHSRQRREERKISKRELQEAVKYGRKERANPGRDGRPRWRFIHKGVVFITDETGRHEITSWRMEDAGEAPPPAPSATCQPGASAAHVVVVVDHSGSMRKSDVPGYDSRTAAVYDCLARDLVEPQLKDGGAAGMEVSIIEMNHGATILCKRLPTNEKLLDYIKGRKASRARSHGNYLPALDAALELMKEDAGHTNQLFLVFLSDGAPSDHTEMACPHGVRVWQPDPQGGVNVNGRPLLQKCHVDNGCRAALHRKVATDCVERVKRLGDLLGRDRVFVGTVAFGPPDEDYGVLRAMAGVLPRSSFQKLGLSAGHLRTAFTSLASTLTTLRTDAAAAGGGGWGGAAGRGGTDPLTLRSDIAETGSRKLIEDLTVVTNGDGWDLYVGDACVRKRRYLVFSRTWEPVPYVDTPHVRSLTNVYDNTLRGIAHAKCKFGEGAERVVFQCSEVVSTDGGKTGFCVGLRLVAKQTRYEEHVKKEDFHRDFCRTQAEAEDMAQLFNERLAGGPQVQLRFLPCHVYTIAHPVHGSMEVLAEEELDGTYTKWNNNGGAVRRSGLGPAHGAGSGGGLGAIAEDGPEEEDEEEAEEEEEAPGGWPRAGAAAGGLVCDIDDVPQAFSHFTFDVTCGQKLVCDLQGVWNPTDGFTLTDPVIHHVAKRNGATDKGTEGMERFFATHTCNQLCRRLGLNPHPKQPDFAGGSRVRGVGL